MRFLQLRLDIGPLFAVHGFDLPMLSKFNDDGILILLIISMWKIIQFVFEIAQGIKPLQR